MGTLTWSSGGTGGDFFYEQNDTQGGGSAGGSDLIPDGVTIGLTGNTIAVNDYVSKSYVDGMFATMQTNIANIKQFIIHEAANETAARAYSQANPDVFVYVAET